MGSNPGYLLKYFLLYKFKLRPFLHFHTICQLIFFTDMESFKAANPGCVLADFVRWHSPRDWDQDKCKLSPRMEIEGNIWKEAWENSKPVPAKRQRRLFDDTREAEKVLQYLTNLKPSEAAHLLMPVLEHAAIVRISKEANESIIGT